MTCPMDDNSSGRRPNFSIVQRAAPIITRENATSTQINGRSDRICPIYETPSFAGQSVEHAFPASQEQRPKPFLPSPMSHQRHGPMPIPGTSPPEPQPRPREYMLWLFCNELEIRGAKMWLKYVHV